MAEQKIILIVDDEALLRGSLSRILKQAGYKVITAEDGQAALESLRQKQVNLILTDLKMPKMDGLQLLKAAKMLAPEIEVIVMTAFGEVATAVEAMQEGAYSFITKPFKRPEILLPIARALEKQTLVRENRFFREKLEAEHHFRNIIGKSPAMRELITKVQQIASSTASVLILGESGTGKEVFANALHFAGSRANKPMIKVSCAALPDTLLESELFGYEKGGFTGATGRKLGRFELADGGTLLLDEIGDMPTHLQVKLLRVLQEGEFERLGGTKTIRVDVRLITATNKNLTAEVKAKNFREDLYYRLNVITLELPPLRDRKEDIPLFVDNFIRKYSEKNDKRIRGISHEALEALESYSWPGNVRELENVIERAVVLTQAEVLALGDLPDSTHPHKSSNHTSITIPLGTSMKEIEHQVILETLQMTGGDKELAARLLGISSRTIYRKLDEVKSQTTRKHKSSGLMEIPK